MSSHKMELCKFSLVDELEKQGVFDNTVLVSQSDFGRTLSSNGEGTDHAWAGNHFVLGGSVLANCRQLLVKGDRSEGDARMG